jgi:hypothetical protein
MQNPPTSKHAVEIAQASGEPVPTAQNNVSPIPAASRISPLISLALLPRESILHVSAIEQIVDAPCGEEQVRLIYFPSIVE